MQLALAQGYRCASCRDLLHPDSQADHVVPWSLSGDDDDSNIQLLCPNCHAAKSGNEAGRIRIARSRLSQLVVSAAPSASPAALAPFDTRVCWACLEFV
jgi:hypothetical protein